MALIDDVKAVCSSLASAGWRDLLLEFGLDIAAANLKTELGRKLPALGNNRPAVTGFEDLSLQAVRGIEPGVPDRSLLFHALASPGVVRKTDGSPLSKFPTPKQIETIENYIYSLNQVNGTAASLKSLVQKRAGSSPANPKFAVVVFAEEYRPASETVHRLEAGMCFSRTGVARIGTEELQYSPKDRGYLPNLPGQPHAFCVLPARYAAYIAWRAPGKGPLFGPMEPQNDDPTTQFWVPIHKLFDGTECLTGKNLKITLNAFHVNEKLRRIHLRPGFGTVNVPGADFTQPPFVIRDQAIADFDAAAASGQGLLRPKPQPLVEKPTIGNKTLAYLVPANDPLSSSLRIPDIGDFRRAPEYVHARHRLNPNGSISNLNDPAVEPNVEQAVANGGYFAVHYIDHTGDGWITVTLNLDLGLPALAAYSLVTAPDFYFSAAQRGLTAWTADTSGKRQPTVPAALRTKLWAVDPLALCGERMAASLALNAHGASFDPNDVTMTAVVGLPLPDREDTNAPESEVERHEWLPDAASRVFAPGWDVSQDRTNGVAHLAAYGLGSPFPEDAKLCAALSTFWPSVAPDVARVFEPNAIGASWPTVAPMTDEEVGIAGNEPVDGYPGPRLLPSGTEVEYTAFARADYVESALNQKFTLALTSTVGTFEYRSRVLRMARVYSALKSIATVDKRAEWAVLSFGEASPDDAELLAAEHATGISLSGTIHRFQMYRHGQRTPVGDKMRVRVAAGSMTTLFVGDLRILKKQGAGDWTVTVG
jgi:hypothetical protein